MRGLDQALRFGGVHLLAEEIGIATEVVGRREGDRVDAILDGDRMPAAGNLAIRWASACTNSPSAARWAAARLIQPYRSASSAS